MFENFYLNVKLLSENASKPTLAYSGDAGYDLYLTKNVELTPGQLAFLPTGIATEFPKGYVCCIRDRGSTPKDYLVVAGVIDSGFRGEWFVQVLARSRAFLTVGTKIAQFLVLPVYTGELTLVNSLIQSERNLNMLGSSN